MRSSHPIRCALVAAVTAVSLATLAGCARDPEKPTLSELAVSSTKSLFRTDSDMQKVLNAQAAFDPKAIEKNHAGGSP